MNDSLENMRLLLELSLNNGKNRKSPQTGYIHHCYHLAENEPHLPIPLIENFLFALALLRSRTVENIQEARTVLEGLLHFQNRIPSDPANGNFPIYIHEFPICKDRFIGIHVACVIIWILKQFHQVIGQELKKRLEESLTLIIKQTLNTYAEKPATYPTAIKIAAATLAGGQLLGDHQMAEKGLSMLEELRNHPDDFCLFCPASLGSITASLLMIYPKLSESPWKFLWDHLQRTWHRGTASYAGPSLKEWQERWEPQVTLYDLICGYFSGVFSQRALKENSALLEAVLIPFCEERFEIFEDDFDVQGMIQGANWFLHHGKNMAYSSIEKGKIVINQIYEKGFHPFRLIWGDTQKVHSFVCQGGNALDITFQNTDVIFDLSGPVEVEDKEKNREIIFFLDAYEDMEFLVSEEKASTFRLGDVIAMRDPRLSLTLSFHVEEGEGRFFGHRMLGNRPAQLAVKGGERFNAYDWQIFFRTLDRSDRCRVRAKLQIGYE